jgi:hypothetical protein
MITERISQKDFVFSTTKVIGGVANEMELFSLAHAMLDELINMYQTTEKLGMMIGTTGGLIRSWRADNSVVRLSYALSLARLYVGTFLPKNIAVCQRTYEIFRVLMRDHKADLKMYDQYIQLMINDISQRGVPVQHSVLSKLTVLPEHFKNVTLSEPLLKQEAELALLVTTEGTLVQMPMLLKAVEGACFCAATAKEEQETSARIRLVDFGLLYGCGKSLPGIEHYSYTTRFYFAQLLKYYAKNEKISLKNQKKCLSQDKKSDRIDENIAIEAGFSSRDAYNLVKCVIFSQNPMLINPMERGAVSIMQSAKKAKAANKKMQQCTQSEKNVLTVQ